MHPRTSGRCNLGQRKKYKADVSLYRSHNTVEFLFNTHLSDFKKKKIQWKLLELNYSIQEFVCTSLCREKITYRFFLTIFLPTPLRPCRCHTGKVCKHWRLIVNYFICSYKPIAGSLDTKASQFVIFSLL